TAEEQRELLLPRTRVDLGDLEQPEHQRWACLELHLEHGIEMRSEVRRAQIAHRNGLHSICRYMWSTPASWNPRRSYRPAAWFPRRTARRSGRPVCCDSIISSWISAVPIPRPRWIGSTAMSTSRMGSPARYTTMRPTGWPSARITACSAPEYAAS